MNKRHHNGMARTIYVADARVWDRAVAYACYNRVSVSRLILDALTFYMDNAAKQRGLQTK